MGVLRFKTIPGPRCFTPTRSHLVRNLSRAVDVRPAKGLQSGRANLAGDGRHFIRSFVCHLNSAGKRSHINCTFGSSNWLWLQWLSSGKHSHFAICLNCKLHHFAKFGLKGLDLRLVNLNQILYTCPMGHLRQQFRETPSLLTRVGGRAKEMPRRKCWKKRCDHL